MATDSEGPLITPPNLNNDSLKNRLPLCYVTFKSGIAFRSVTYFTHFEQGYAL